MFRPQRLDETKLPAAAMGASFVLDAGDTEQECADRLDHGQRGGRYIERRTGSRQAFLLAGRRQQAVVTDAFETARQDMEQKSRDELGSR